MSTNNVNTEIKRSGTGIFLFSGYRLSATYFDFQGVFTVEGNVAGARAGRLTQEREEQKQDFERRKQAIADESNRITVSKIDDKFNRHIDHQEFKNKQYGLVKLADFRKMNSPKAADSKGPGDGTVAKKRKKSKK